MLNFKASTASQSITAATTAYSTGYLGYAAESAINQTPFDNRIAHMNGAISCLNGTFNFISGGFAGSFGTIGTKGKFLVSGEWWYKTIVYIGCNFLVKKLFNSQKNSLEAAYA